MRQSLKTSLTVSRLLEPLAWTTTAGIVVLDLRLPPGFAVGVLYVVVILAGLWIARLSFLIQYALVATVLEIGGLFLRATAGSWPMSLFNHVMSIMAVWITAGGIALYRRASADRQATEERLREQQAFADLGRMAASVAHEVRNALAAVGSALHIVHELTPPGIWEVGIRAQMTQRLAALSDVVTDLLAFVDARPMVVAPVSLKHLVEEAVANARARPSCEAVKVRIDVPDTLVRVDRDQIQRVLFNLIVNAAQATPSEDEVVVRAEATGGRWQLQVVDRGPGLPSAARSRLFEPFFSTKSQGIGLGLAFAKRVVNGHGGTIDLNCPDDGGTVVRLNLPWQPV